MRHWRAGLGTFFSLGMGAALVAGAAGAAQAPTPLSPQAGWATTYLLSTALAAEYEAVMAALPGSTAARVLYFRGALGRSLFTRGRFALTALQARGQEFPGAQRLAQLLGEQEAALGSAPAVLESSRAVTQAGEVGPLTAREKGVEAGFAALSGSFALPATRGRWERLASTYAMPTPTCPIDYQDVQGFAAHQLAALGEGRDAGPRALLAPLAAWSPGQVQCLIFSLMAASPTAKATEGFEPLPLMQALQTTGSPLARDVSVTALMAVRYLQLGRYAETLAALLDLSDVDDAFRLPYDVVQRVFSMRQRGDGAVALQGL